MREETKKIKTERREWEIDEKTHVYLLKEYEPEVDDLLDSIVDGNIQNVRNLLNAYNFDKDIWLFDSRRGYYDIGRFALCYANTEIVKLLLSHGYFKYNGYPRNHYICKAIKKGTPELIDILNSLFRVSNEDEMADCICEALRENRFDLVKHFVERYRWPVSQSGDSPFLWACDTGKLDIVKYILSHGGSMTDSNSPDTAITVCIENGSVDILKYLFEQGHDFTEDDCIYDILNSFSYDNKSPVSAQLRIARILFDHGLKFDMFYTIYMMGLPINNCVEKYLIDMAKAQCISMDTKCYPRGDNLMLDDYAWDSFASERFSKFIFRHPDAWAKRKDTVEIAKTLLLARESPQSPFFKEVFPLDLFKMIYRDECCLFLFSDD